MKLIGAGKPAVFLASEAFRTLSKATLKSRRMPEATSVVIRGNPEFLSDDALVEVADRAMAEVVQRLTTGAGSCDTLIE